MRDYLLIVLSFFLLSFTLFTSCKKEEIADEKIEEEISKPYNAGYSRFDPVDSDEFGLVHQNVLSTIIDEASGIASGRKNKHVVYTHDDSGGEASVYVYDTLANYLGMFQLASLFNRDWEDIVVGPGPVDGESYIYVADFGDNSAARSGGVIIYRFLEPNISQIADENFRIVINHIDQIRYTYPDGARDAEALMIDPFTKDLIIVTKRESSVHVYALHYPHNLETSVEAEYYGQLPFRRVVAGDISPNGKHILVKDIGAIYHWDVINDNPIKTMFDHVPVKVAYVPEVQGEAVGWANDNNGYFTLSESKGYGIDPVLYYYKRK